MKKNIKLWQTMYISYECDCDCVIAMDDFFSVENKNSSCSEKKYFELFE